MQCVQLCVHPLILLFTEQAIYMQRAGDSDEHIKNTHKRLITRFIRLSEPWREPPE